jgi:broad specificity phosphatase PhoE
MKSATIYIVRHGETDWNKNNKVQGHTDIPLNKTGINQAKKLAKILKKIRFDAVFSSDLIRSIKTAQIISRQKRDIIITSERLREKYMGKYEGTDTNLFFKKLFKKYEEMTHEQNHTYKMSPEMESNEEAVNRFLVFLKEVSIKFAGKKILVVCHGGIMGFLLIHLKTASYHAFPIVNNNGFIVLESDGNSFTVKKTSGIEKVKK